MILNLHTQIRILRDQYSYLRNDVLANRAFCAVACGKLPHHAYEKQINRTKQKTNQKEKKRLRAGGDRGILAPCSGWLRDRIFIWKISETK